MELLIAVLLVVWFAYVVIGAAINSGEQQPNFEERCKAEYAALHALSLDEHYAKKEEARQALFRAVAGASLESMSRYDFRYGTEVSDALNSYGSHTFEIVQKENQCSDAVATIVRNSMVDKLLEEAFAVEKPKRIAEMEARAAERRSNNETARTIASKYTI